MTEASKLTCGLIRYLSSPTSRCWPGANHGHITSLYEAQSVPSPDNSGIAYLRLHSEQAQYECVEIEDFEAGEEEKNLTNAALIADKTKLSHPTATLSWLGLGSWFQSRATGSAVLWQFSANGSAAGQLTFREPKPTVGSPATRPTARASCYGVLGKREDLRIVDAGRAGCKIGYGFIRCGRMQDRLRIHSTWEDAMPPFSQAMKFPGYDRSSADVDEECGRSQVL
ncbi:hypothetical protein PMIN01_13659 [Paraphaeosphaeria minitans]|uniref:Uncharacterized protein n=1 Tax=Paraphaeosphaeria minitans TaxID=565426 RepID=A0A9P6KIK3_9PLEO|nr:hypothetical protein PMIN01_13659 [Paraphaeosphaeria minitans]